jgi:hypothetical protein
MDVLMLHGLILTFPRLANFFHRLEAPRWTSYLDECSQILIDTGDHPNDKAAVSLVKIQVLADKIGQSPWHGRLEALHTNTPPPILYLDSLREQLKELKTQLSLDQRSHGQFLRSHISAGSNLLTHFQHSGCPSKLRKCSSNIIQIRSFQKSAYYRFQLSRFQSTRIPLRVSARGTVILRYSFRDTP